MVAVQSPYLIKKRIVEKSKLEGVLIENQSKIYQLDTFGLLNLIEVKKRVVLVDSPVSDDNPSSLSIVHEKIADGLRFYFRSVRDKVKTNDFNRTPKVKLISARKYPILKLNV